MQENLDNNRLKEKKTIIWNPLKPNEYRVILEEEDSLKQIWRTIVWRKNKSFEILEALTNTE
jgi:hypothetical protein